MLSDQGLVSPEKIEKRLRILLPFTDLALTPETANTDNEVSLRANEQSALMSSYEKITFDQGRKYLCCGNTVLPELGTVGEVLIALTVTNKLLQATGKPQL